MFPSVINTFNIVSASDRLNSPSHSALHNSVSSVLTQVQTVIGTNVTSALGTIIGDLRNPASDGGGHVQTAVKGGTGQTTFTKGDLLVATGPSVISKLAIGLDGQALVADSSVASGVKWGTPGGTKVNNSGVPSTVSNIIEGSIISAIIPGSTLGTSNAVRASAYITHMEGENATASILVSGTYGNTRVANMTIVPGALGSVVGKIEFIILANNATNAQIGNMVFTLSRGDKFDFSTQTSVFTGMVSGSASEDSTSNKAVGITAHFQTIQLDNRIDHNGWTVEKIT